MTDPTRGPWLSRRTMRIAGWLLLGAAMAAIAWFVISRPLLVNAVRPERGELVVEVFGTGTLESKIVVGMSAKITGKVVEVRVDQGDSVTAGQLLALLENTDFENAARVAAAQCDQARADLAKAKAEAKRRRVLVERNVISREELDTYETAERVAEAQVKNTEAGCGVARAKLADTRIESPASGVVITRNLEIGATVVPGTPIFRIAASTPWIAAQVDEHATGAVEVGQPVRVYFQTDPALPQPGRVARLGEEADRVTEEREVDVALDRLPENHFLGQRAEVYIETARKDDALQVSRNALVERDVNAGLFVVVGGRARWRQVQIGLKGRTMAEIIGGVNEQDLIVLNPLAGAKPLADGARVKVSTGSSKP